MRIRKLCRSLYN